MKQYIQAKKLLEELEQPEKYLIIEVEEKLKNSAKYILLDIKDVFDKIQQPQENIFFLFQCLTC